MRMIKACEVLQSLILLFLFAALPAQAAEPTTAQTSDDELVKQSQNPVADLISVPFQNNCNFSAGKKIGRFYVAISNR